MGCELPPSQPLPFQGAYQPVLTDFRTSFFLCSFAISDAYSDRAASLTARAVFISQGNALCKAMVPCSVSTDEAGFCKQHPTSGVSPPQELPSPCKRQALFQLPGFLRALALLHKTRLSLSDFHLVTETWFICSQLLSFLLIFPSQPQDTNPVYLHSSTPKPDLQTVPPNYCRTEEISPIWLTAWRGKEEIEGELSSRSYPSSPPSLVLLQPHFIVWQEQCEMV